MSPHTVFSSTPRRCLLACVWQQADERERCLSFFLLPFPSFSRFWSAVPCHRFGRRLGARRRIGFRKPRNAPGTQSVGVVSSSSQSGDKAPHSKMDERCLSFSSFPCLSMKDACPFPCLSFPPFLLLDADRLARPLDHGSMAAVE